MKIEHVAIWTHNLERLREFYTRYFNGISNEKYTNPNKGFEPYFISFGEGARLELMQTSTLSLNATSPEKESIDFTHLAFSVGTRGKVNELTEMLRSKGYQVAGEPRQTGDGYYESVILDPDGNRIEITE